MKFSTFWGIDYRNVARIAERATLKGWHPSNSGHLGTPANGDT